MTELKEYKRRIAEKEHHYGIGPPDPSYREEGKGCLGGEEALKWYKEAMELAQKGEEYDQKNYEYYYDCQTHCRSYERKGKKYFEKAALAYKRSAELGNELAMMNYALYLFAFKDEYEAALSWFRLASEWGLATADYQLACLYRHGDFGVEANEETAQQYCQRYKQRCLEDERQLMLAWNLDDDWEILGRGILFSWFQGISCRLQYDTPRAKTSKWKYGD